MDNSLMLYLNKRLGKSGHDISPESLIPGPVITFSREVGCGALKIAKKLEKELNSTDAKHHWKILSKEIFDECARELDMNKQKINHILKAEERSTFDEILSAFGDKRFKSERLISKTVLDLIRSSAIDGHCIIVGRGGHIITRNIENSLHIRLTAPLEWRIEKIMENHDISRLQAKEQIEKTEKERDNFRKHLCPKELNLDQFGLVINVSVFSPDQILDLLRKAMEMRGLLKPHIQKVITG